MNLKTLLRHGINSARSKSYLNWLAHRKKANTEIHHLLGSRLGGKKINDYLCVIIPKETHVKLHYNNLNENFEQLLVESLNNLFDYIKYLEDKNE